MERDDIGEIGQDDFRSWCTKAGIVAVPPTRDRMGWDFLLNMSAPGGPDDAAERLVKIQVKTSTEERPSAAISMANWKRMAMERSPWFVVYLVLDGKDVKDAYLVHIGEQHVAAALRRLRELELGLAETRTMTLTPASADRLRPPWPEALRERVLAHLGSTEDAYFAAKSSWVRTSGYEGGRYGVGFDVAVSDGADPTALIADWVVGLLPTLPIRAMRVVERRFGVESVLQDVREIQGYATLGAVPSWTTAKITLTASDKSERVVLETEVRSARRCLPWLPVEYERVHFAGKGISFVSQTTDTTASFRAQLFLPAPGQLTPLDDLSRVCKALRMLAAGKEFPAEALFEVPGIQPIRAPMQGDVTLTEEAMRFVRVMEWAASVARQFDIPLTLNVDPGELMVHALQVAMLAAGLERRADEMNVGIPCVDATVQSRDVVFLVAPAFPLGEEIVAGVFGIAGTAEWSPKRGGWVRIEKPTIRAFSRAVAREGEWRAELVGEKVDAAVATLRAEGQGYVFAPRRSGA